MSRRENRLNAVLRSVGIYDGIGIKEGHPIATPLLFLSVAIALSCFAVAFITCLAIAPVMNNTVSILAIAGMVGGFLSTICCYAIAGAPSSPAMRIRPGLLEERKQRELAHLRGETV